MKFSNTRKRPGAPRLPRSTRVRLEFDSLEARIVPYALAGDVWPHPEMVTISFVPDGTIVTFIESGNGQGKSTVDARVKHGIAKATLPAVPGATLSVASGVVLGNELHWGGR